MPSSWPISATIIPAQVVGIGLVRTTAATLLNATACPAGTHTAAQAATCWPTRRFISEAAFGGCTVPALVDSTLRSMSGRAGTGAGNVYLVSAGIDPS